MSSRARVGRAMVHSTAGTAVTRILGALGGVAVARLLGPAARGDVAVLVVIGSLAGLVGATGLQFWVSRAVAARGGVDASVRSVVVRHSLAVLALGTALGAAVAPFAGAVSGSEVAATTAFAVTAALGYLWLAIPNGARAMISVSAALAAGAAVYLAGAVVLLALDRPSVLGVMVLGVVGNTVTLGIAVAAARRHHLAGARDGGEWGDAVRFGVAGGVGEIVLFGMLRIDFLLVAAFLPAAAVGVYAVATSLSELLWVIPDGTAQIALPSVAAADDDALPAAFRLSLLLTLVAGVALSALASPVLRVVFGPGYASGASAVPFLALAAVVGGAWKMVVADLTARHSSRDRLVSAVVGLATMVAADLVLIPRWELPGAAAAAALGYAAAAAVVVRIWCVTTGRSPRALVGLRAGDLELLRPATSRDGMIPGRAS